MWDTEPARWNIRMEHEYKMEKVRMELSSMCIEAADFQFAALHAFEFAAKGFPYGAD
jgi:hypothetical protein